MLFYIITVLLGIALDFKLGKGEIGNTYRKVFVVWLYIFLCFGYMTGSDWRDYELSYNFMETINDLDFSNEVGFNFIFFILKKVFVDFWIVVGLLKCLYLFTLIRVVKALTPFWLSVVSLMVTGDLAFVLIDNPLRFMTALILVNLSMELCLNKRYWIGVLLVFLSFFLHNASLFFVLLIPCFRFAEIIAKWKKLLIISLYALVVVVSFNPLIIETMRQFMISMAKGFNESVGTYSAYTVESNASFFSLGNLAGIVLFFVVIFTRDVIVMNYNNGKFIYGMTIIYAMLSKLLFIIPTGFRLAIPFGLFYMVYMVYLIRSKSVMKWAFIAYISLSFPLNFWDTYKYIPYSNSIPYIIAGHKDYHERSMHNINAYKKRVGKSYDGIY